MPNPFETGDYIQPLTTLTNGLVPIVIEQSNRGERSFDIFPGCCASGLCSSPAWSRTIWPR
jgi:hypothetical protein